MIIIKALAWAFAVGLAMVGPANATLVVDTGEPSFGRLDPFGDPVLSVNQWLAGQFVLSGSYRITKASGFISSANRAASIIVAIYSDGGHIPGTELFSATAEVPALTFADGSPVPTWNGPSGLDWELHPGIYWIAFEVRPGQTFEGFMANPAPNPLAHFAIHYNNQYYPDSEFRGVHVADIGVRIEGEAAPVSEPDALALFGIGAFALRLTMRRVQHS